MVLNFIVLIQQNIHYKHDISHVSS